MSQNGARELRARLEAMTATWPDRDAAKRVVENGLRKLFEGNKLALPSSKRPTESARKPPL